VSFGTTAPMNAVRGHFWWNGKVLAIFDGAAWVNTVTGVIVPPDGSGGGGGGSGQGTVIISSTAPGNPVAGMQWWDGSQLRVFDGTQWNVVGPGSAVGPVPTTTHTFSITQPTPVTVPTGAWGILNFTTTPQVDTTLGWDAATMRFTPKKAGIYMFTIRAYIATNGGLVLTKNDPGTYSDAPTDQVVASSTLGGAGTSAWQTASAMTLMNGTTDFVRAFVLEAAGTFSGSGQNPVISGWLMP